MAKAGKPRRTNLLKVTIEFKDNVWVVTRERKETGERGIFNTLESALDFVHTYLEQEKLGKYK